MKIVGRQAVFEKIDMPRYEAYPLDVARWLGTWITINRCFESLDAHEYWIPEFVQDRLVQQ